MKRMLVLLCGLIISHNIALQADGADVAARGAVTGRQTAVILEMILMTVFLTVQNGLI